MEENAPELDQPKKCVLILTSDAGYGHRSVANALKAALDQKYGSQCETHIVNPLDDPRAPTFLRDSEDDYTRLVRNAPELYRLGYKVSDAEFPHTIIESVLTVSLYEVMGELVRQHQPHVIVSTHTMYQPSLAAYFGLNKVYVPLIVVVPDLANVTRLWFEPDVDLFLVPSEAVKNIALKYGLKEEKLHITGIPVSPKFANNKRSKADIRADLGWHPYLPTFLAVGSPRVNGLAETLNVLNHFGLPLQVAATAGGDEGLLVELKAIDWHIPAHLYGYVENMPEMMLASDAVISKAGGLVVSESLASGLPILIIDVIPGQEEGNRDYVIEHGAGLVADNPIQVLEALAHWMKDDGSGLRQAAEKARRIGRPTAALESADLIWQAAQQGAKAKLPLSELRRARLIDLLTHNQITWDKKPKTDKKKKADKKPKTIKKKKAEKPSNRKIGEFE